MVWRVSQPILVVFAVITLLTPPALAPISEGGELLDGDIEIVRDDYGVPHVFAKTRAGLAFGVGYAVAQDRLWQADLFRRQATGRLAEFGLVPIESDYLTRRDTYSLEERTELFDALASPYKEMTVAYVAGINRYISEAVACLLKGDLSMLPVEYLAISLDLKRPILPEPWTVEDSLAIGQMMVKAFGEAGGNELSYASVLSYLYGRYPEETAWGIFNDMFPQCDPGADTTLPGESKHIHSSLPTTPFPDSVVDAAEKDVEERRYNQQIFKSLGLFTGFGSNAWVVSPSKSATGNALLQGGPQMGHTIPQIVLEVGMHGAGIDCVGMTFPGAGSVILIGVNRWGAWTTTSGLSDEVDTYIEVLNTENPYQYWYEGGWCDMERRTERIYGPACAYYEDGDIYRTVHGPVFAWDLTNNFAYIKKRAFWKQEVNGTIESFFHFQECRDTREFERAVEGMVSSHNMLWADRFGNVGYWHVGRYPVRPEGVDDRLPLWGTGEEEWFGFIPFSELPQGKNPDEGFYANWNNKPSPGWEGSEYDWGEGHIVVRIQELLAADPEVSFEDMIEVCRNVAYHDAYGTYLKGFLVNATEGDPSVPEEVVEYLREWDNYLNDENLDGYYDDPGLTIFSAWYDAIFDPIFADDLGDMSGYVSPHLLLHVFDGEESKLPLSYDYLNGVPRDEIIVSTLKGVIVDLEESYGTSNASLWLTPVQRVWFTQLGALPTTSMPFMNRGTYNQIAELPRWSWGDWRSPPHAVNVLPPGQSGFVNYLLEPSPHSYDQLPLYEGWQFKPMLFGVEEIWKLSGP